MLQGCPPSCLERHFQSRPDRRARRLRAMLMRRSALLAWLAGEGPVLELLQRGPGCSGGLWFPQLAREEALGHAHAHHQPRLVLLLQLHFRVVLQCASCAEQGCPEGTADPAELMWAWPSLSPCIEALMSLQNLHWENGHPWLMLPVGTERHTPAQSCTRLSDE